MPTRANRFCSWSGCRELTTSRYCAAHQAEYERKQADENKRYDKRRGNSNGRGYDGTWRVTRLMYLRAHPLCQVCSERGLVVPAVLVHHATPLSEGGARLDADNFVAVCRACHEAIHGPERWTRREAP